MNRPSGSAEQPAYHWEDSSARRPAGHWTSLSLFARLPPEILRQLIGLLSYSDVAACSCSTSHEDTKRLLMGYMRRRCCISTFKRLLVLFGAITGTLEPKWDTDFWNESELRKDLYLPLHFEKASVLVTKLVCQCQLQAFSPP